MSKIILTCGLVNEIGTEFFVCGNYNKSSLSKYPSAISSEYIGVLFLQNIGYCSP